MRSASGSPTNRPLRAVDSAGPLAAGELDALFAPIADANRIGLAVSGGADSLALLVTAAAWSARRGRPDILVLTVDHRLREASAADAATVVAIATRFGLAARLLVSPNPQPDGDVEGAARTARYRLLVQAARDAGASHLLLAHQRDDQAETFLMRLQRGSGLFGLAAMRSEVRAGGLTLFRPFLDVARARLAATTAAAGLVPLDDPMNHDPRFLRARIRRVMPLLAAEGFGPAELAATARRLARAADAIDAAVDRLIAEGVSVDGLGVATIAPAPFGEAPEEVRQRLLVRLIMAIGGEDYPPRSDRLQNLHDAIRAHPLRGRFKRTLGGTVIEGRGRRFVAYREAGRQGLPVIALRAGEAVVWDHRFRVTAGQGIGGDLNVGGLGEADRRSLGIGTDRAPAPAIAALPALRSGAGIVAVPSVGWVSEGEKPDVAVTAIVAGRLAEPIRFPDLDPGADQSAFTLP